MELTPRGISNTAKWFLFWQEAPAILKGKSVLECQVFGSNDSGTKSGSFCLDGSVTCRDTSSSMITLSNSMLILKQLDNYPRGFSGTVNRNQHPSVPVFPP